MADFQIVIAGFGGQGLLFSGKVLAYAGLLENRELSWLPSYGPEMRGGTANCNVILSDTPVGSPIVQHPNVLMVMNNPSLDKYEDTVAPGGKIFVDSTLISRKVRRTDVEDITSPPLALPVRWACRRLQTCCCSARSSKRPAALALIPSRRPCTRSSRPARPICSTST